ncbi:MAG TPA: hypothetical protein VFD01_08150 [Candidatus Dormibacteraeota bacterium]|nr:hypothetical protein [Candidatus Dormibacteraeota bacterium]
MVDEARADRSPETTMDGPVLAGRPADRTPTDGLVDDSAVPGDETVEVLEPGAPPAVLPVGGGDRLAKLEQLGVVAAEVGGALLGVARGGCAGG